MQQFHLLRHFFDFETALLIWFTDDFIETIFDLKLILHLLDSFESLKIVLVPKQGQNGNDASFEDVTKFLQLSSLSRLNRFIDKSRLEIRHDGPRMGAINLIKLKSSLLKIISQCDAVLVKGCRIHEMIQGGLNKPTYTSFVVTRQFTEAETGLDARKTPLVFFKSEPGEYAYWGFKGNGQNQVAFEDGRSIDVVHSTLMEHESRKSGQQTTEWLLNELKSLTRIYSHLEKDYQRAISQEILLIINQLMKLATQNSTNNNRMYQHDLSVVQKLLAYPTLIDHYYNSHLPSNEEFITFGNELQSR